MSIRIAFLIGTLGIVLTICIGSHSSAKISAGHGSVSSLERRDDRSWKSKKRFKSFTAISLLFAQKGLGL